MRLIAIDEEQNRPMARVAALVVIAVIFVAMKSYAVQYVASDENIYFYLASAMARGEVPHLDFFHAHPPLHLLPLALIYRFLGEFALLPARLLSGGAILLAGFLIAGGRRKPYGVAGVVACALFLASYDVLRISTHYVGSNLAAFWVALALQRLSRARDFQAALAFSLAGFTMLSAAPAAVGATLVVAIADPARGLRLVGLGVLMTLALNGAAAAVFGSSYLEQVYFFHLAKTAVSGQSLDVLVSVLQSNTTLLGWASLGGVALILGTENHEIKVAAVSGSSASILRAQIRSQLPLFTSIGAALASLIFLAALGRSFIYYVQVFFVCVAPLAGFGVVALVGSVGKVFSRVSIDWRVRREVQFNALLLVLLIGASQGFALFREIEASGRPSWSLTRYLSHEADSFTSAPLLAEQASRYCGPEMTLFGDSTSAPLVALLADRKLALGEADTNRMRFSGGDGSISRLLGALEASPPCAVVFRYDHGLFQLSGFRNWLDQHYRRVFEVTNALETRRFELHVRRVQTSGSLPP